MFSTLGLFKGVQCPRIADCYLANCLFDHTLQAHGYETEIATEVEVRKPKSVEGEDQRPTKRRRVDGVTEESPAQSQEPKAGGVSLDLKRKTIIPPPRTSGTASVQPLNHTALAKSRDVSGSRTGLVSVPASVTRGVSPPATKSSIAASRVPEKAIPREVAKAPVPFKSRMSYVELLLKLARGHNSKYAKEASDKSFVLREQQLITLILDDEQAATSAASADIYKNTMSQCYLRYKNMNQEQWKDLVTKRFRSAPPPPSSKQEDHTAVSTGLHPSEEIELLRGLKTAVAGLESYGYVTNPPTTAEILKAKQGVAAAHGFEMCDRCGTRFQVFPGRDSQGRLTTQGSCFYHWARVSRSQSGKNSRAVGASDAQYPCCNKAPGSEGCTKADTHVFKVTDPKRLASLLQFERTPSNHDRSHHRPVAFDCEMAYTTYGLELVRVTAISWPENVELLDVLVRPYGEILDLNTRFSGVSREQFMNAPAADQPAKSSRDGQASTGQLDIKVLRKVESPAAARQLLFDLLSPDTPLIGHAIENDLNACRIVHPFIVDTVLLYPHPAGLPVRYGLKMLAAKYLHRNIQTAGEQGHDSKEDSVATGDLVRVKIADKWKGMKSQGWTFRDGRLTAPLHS